MKRYESYKDSGVKWLGEIPGHWEVTCLRRLLKRDSVKGHPNKPLLSVTREKGVILRGAKGDDGNNNIIPEDLSGYKHVKKGQFVINKMKSWQGSYGVSDFEGIVSPAYFVYDLDIADKRFFSWAIRSKNYVPFFMQYSKGIRVDQWDLTPENVKSIPFFIPPKSEQTAIANYLDSVTSKIDEAISQQQKMIDLLNERKQIIIQNAVTKGLDPNAKMKDSGVEWIGEIPENWEVYKFGRLISLLTDYTANGSFGDLAKNIHYQNEGYARLVRLTDLRENLNNIGVWVDKHGYDFLSKSWLKGGELLIANVGAYSGLPCIMPKVPYPTTLAPNMFLLKLNESKIYTKYIYSLLLSNCYFNWLQTIATSSAQPKLNKDNIRQLIIIHPINIKDQYDIVLYIKKKLHPIDESISQCNKMISLLQERKQIIINDVVTGKVKVI